MTLNPRNSSISSSTGPPSAAKCRRIDHRLKVSGSRQMSTYAIRSTLKSAATDHTNHALMRRGSRGVVVIDYARPARKIRDEVGQRVGDELDVPNHRGPKTEFPDQVCDSGEDHQLC